MAPQSNRPKPEDGRSDASHVSNANVLEAVKELLQEESSTCSTSLHRLEVSMKAGFRAADKRADDISSDVGELKKVLVLGNGQPSLVQQMATMQANYLNIKSDVDRMDTGDRDVADARELSKAQVWSGITAIAAACIGAFASVFVSVYTYTHPPGAVVEERPAHHYSTSHDVPKHEPAVITPQE